MASGRDVREPQRADREPQRSPLRRAASRRADDGNPMQAAAAYRKAQGVGGDLTTVRRDAAPVNHDPNAGAWMPGRDRGQFEARLELLAGGKVHLHESQRPRPAEAMALPFLDDVESEHPRADPVRSRQVDPR